MKIKLIYMYLHKYLTKKINLVVELNVFFLQFKQNKITFIKLYNSSQREEKNWKKGFV